MSLNASAVVTLSPMSEASLRSYIGDTVDAFYLSTDGIYKPCHFHYVYYGDIDHVESADSTVSRWFGGNKAVSYACNDYGTDIDTSGAFAPMFYFPLNLHFKNISHIYYGAAAYRTLNFFDMDLSSLRVYNYLVAGQFNSSVSYMSASSSGSNRPNRAYIWNGAHNYLNGFNSGVYGEFQSSTPTDFYLTDFYFSSAEFVAGSNNVVVHIFTPFVNDDYEYAGSSVPPSFSGSESSSHVTGTITTDSQNGTQNIDISVQTDNTGLIGGILSGIKNLFIPSQNFMNGWHQDLQDAFDDHLGGISDAVSLIDEQAVYLRSATSAEYIYFPELTLPIGSTGYSDGVETIGADYTLIEGRQVELRPARDGNLKILWDFLEFAIDAVCVIAVFNMLQTKYEIFLNPDGEVITYDN